MGVGKSAHVVSAGSCHKVGIELARVGGGSRLRSRNWGVYDRLSLEDERRLMMADSSRVIVAVSRLVREQLLRCYPIDPSKIVVIPNGVDTSLYASMRDQAIREGWRVAMGIRPEDSVLLFVGNEFDRKGVQTIIEALPLLQDLPVVVLVAGDDETSPYRSLAERLNVASKVRFLGRFDRVERLFGIADLFVFPTKYEPFGLVIIEAMAAGVPVITSRHAGAVEDLLDGEHGLFIDDPLSAQELAASIRRLMVNPQLQSRLAETCRTMVKKFDWTKIGDSFEELYRRIASEAPPTDAL
jgi:UDP-glucose:(heptosyl)LPS alpha-1,3-glucosyltransferase